MRFYVTEHLGPNREITLQGFLLCKAVPIARTGQQIYGPGQTPIEAGEMGRVVVSREAAEVFSPETIDSFNGSAFVVWRFDAKLSHPKDSEGEGADVTPATWKEYSAGFVFNVRRGKGIEGELLLADILVCDAEAIRLITEEGFTELSCGYDSNYVQDAPGIGRQVNIRGNHVALVENGRCGWQCSIQDSADIVSGGSMAKSVKKEFAAFRAAVLAKFSTVDSAELQKVSDEVEKKVEDESEGSGDTHIHLGTAPNTDAPPAWATEILTRLTALEGRKTADAEETAEEKAEREKKEASAKKAEDDAKTEEEKKVEDDLEEEAPDGVSDEARKAEDSMWLEDSFQATVSSAEILAPGISFPTFDSNEKPKTTLGTITKFRRKALNIAASTPVGATIIAELRGGKTITHDSLEAMSTAEVRTLFHGATSAMKQRNSTQHHQSATASTRVHDAGAPSVRPNINEVNRNFWAKQK